MAFNQSCYGLRGKSGIDNGYLLFVLRLLTDQMKARSSGATFGSITTRTLETFQIPVPPLPVQRQILTEIELVEATEIKAVQALASAKQTIDEIVVGCYTSDRPKRMIESLSTLIQYGLSKPMNEDGIGYKIFRMNEVVDRRMVDTGNMKYIDISAEEFAGYRLNKGDVLFNRTNSIEHVGKTGLFDLEGDYCFASYLVRIVPDKNEVFSDFLALMMSADEFQTKAKATATRSINQANINATKMKNMEVPAPSLKEQQRLLAEIAKHEIRRAQAEAEIAAAPAKKRQILLDGIK